MAQALEHPWLATLDAKHTTEVPHAHDKYADAPALPTQKVCRRGYVSVCDGAQGSGVTINTSPTSITVFLPFTIIAPLPLTSAGHKASCEGCRSQQN